MSTISTLFGEEVITKSCVCCKEIKPITKFSPRTRDKNGNPTEYRNDCNDCQKEKSRDVKQLKKQYPRPDLLVYKCPICERDKQDLAYTAWLNPFVLDHDHQTGLARGWICQDCNTAIARLKDNVNSAKNLIEYLQAERREPYLGCVVDSLEQKV